MLKLRPLSWVIIAINLLFLFGTISGVSETTKSCEGLTGDDLSICQAGTAIGAGIGVGIILFFWVLIDLILLIVWLVSNKNQSEDIFAQVGGGKVIGVFDAALNAP